MNAWLIGSTVLLAALLPLLAVAFLRPPEDGLVALEMAGVDAALAMLLAAEGIDRQSVSDVALVLGVASLIGSLAFATLLEREP
jgi:multisubunit Na+/H+ antiporter MnhF subunit